MSAVYIWGDGSSTGRANREWGYGFVIAIDDEPVFCDYGGGPHGTNNIAECEALIQGMLAFAELKPSHPEWPSEVILVSDSTYALGSATGEYVAKKNFDLTERLSTLYNKYCTGIKKVKGHSGEHLNERCDFLARLGKQKFSKPK